MRYRGFISNFHVSPVCANSVRTRAAGAMGPYLAGARGDVLECLPALGKQRKASFTQAPRRVEQHIPGARVDVQLFDALRFLHGREDAVTCAVVPAVCQARHLACVIPQHRQQLPPRRGQVMDIARQHVRDRPPEPGARPGRTWRPDGAQPTRRRVAYLGGYFSFFVMSGLPR